MYNEQKYIGKRCDRDDGRQLAKHESAGQDGRWWLVCVRCGRGGRLGRGDAGGRLGSIMSNEPNSTHHGGTEGTETGANAIPEKHQGQCSVLLCRNNWKFFPDNLEMVMQVRVAERVRPRAEAQRRWDGKGVAVLLFSASQRLCARTYWFRPQAALGASAFICGSGVLARGLRTHPTVANRGFGLGVDSDGVVGVLVRW